MKKTLSLMVLLTLSLIVLSGCGQNSGNVRADNSQVKEFEIKSLILMFISGV